MSIKNFFDLWDWREAEDLADEIYGVTLGFPKEEKYILVAQLRAAAISIFSNIAEGSGRGTYKDYSQFLIQARGSAKEVIAQLHFANRGKYLSDEKFLELFNRYNRLAAAINNHINSLKPDQQEY